MTTKTKGNGFKEALTRQGFRWTKRFGGSWTIIVNEYPAYVLPNTHTAILMLDRESFPKYLAMSSEDLRDFLQKFFNKNRMGSPGASFTLSASYVEACIKPFMAALLEVS